MFEIVKEVLENAVQENLSWVVLAIICVAMLYTINSLLGCAIAYFKDKIDWNKLGVSTLRNIVVCLCIFASCYALNVFVLTLNIVEGVTINVDMVTAMEILTIVITWCIDLAKDIVEKFKSFKELKYVKYEDVVLDDGIGDSEARG